MLPHDIDPQSRCRLPLPRRDDMDEAGRRLYDEAADPSGVSLRGLRGPGGIQLHSPRLAAHARPLNRYLRHEAGLDARVREIAILTAVRECDGQFQWAAHEPEALRVGVPPAVIDIIKQRRSTRDLADAEAAIIELGRAFFRTRKVASPTFARALMHHGARGLVDIVALMGSYAGTAMLLAVFDMQLDQGQEPPLPVP
jgi:4-carboxymuconolactone decarboxylase